MKTCNYTQSIALHKLGYKDKGGEQWLTKDGRIPMPRLDDAAYFIARKYNLHAVVQPCYMGKLFCASLFDAEKICNLMANDDNNYRSYEAALAAIVEKAIKTIQTREK